jgi:hypothetical protein
MTRSAAIACLLLVSAVAVAADLHIRVIPTAGARDCLRNGAIIANGDGNQVQAGLSPEKSDYMLHVPSPGPWQLHVATAGACWSEQREWNDGNDVSLRLFQTGIVEGDFTVSRGIPPPATVQGNVFIAEKQSAPDTFLPSTAQCAVAKLHWRCSVPAGVTFDLRLDTPGNAATHFWDILVEPNHTSALAAQPLYGGATLAGWARDARDKPLKNARITCFRIATINEPAAHAAAQLATARTTHRGFFQCTGLTEGQYRLILEAPNLSPLTISPVDLRGGRPMLLPKVLRPMPFGEVAISFTPPVDGRGKPWSADFTEATALYPGKSPKTITRLAAADGHLTAKGLRADLYELLVRDSVGAVVDRRDLDLFGGGPHALALDIRPVWIDGVARTGDSPLKADLLFADTATGKLVKASSDEQGRFEATLSGAGKWGVTVLYPPGRSPARIQAPALQIPEDALGTVHEVSIDIPGGRIHGTVVGNNGEIGPAVVHARRDQRTAGQQMADENGTFDLIGLGAGTYRLDAQNKVGTTPEPLEVELGKNETREVKLVTEPMTVLSGVVLTPDGRPASGAIIRLLTADGHGWATVVADVRGHYEYPVGRATRAVPMVVLSYDYPATFLTAIVQDAGANEQTIHFRTEGGLLRVHAHGATADVLVSARGVSAPYGILHPQERYAPADTGVYLEPGTYDVCASGDTCREVTIGPGANEDITLVAQKGAP